ncbi:membrane protein [Mycobacterium phage Aegeus]|nr:membrane protein [Mycobacterium phage Baudelaire]WKW86543.1 membrane protein [Mycobacterium phage Aegeus]
METALFVVMRLFVGGAYCGVSTLPGFRSPADALI